MWTSEATRGRALALALLALMTAHGSALAEGGFGSQREGTSSATFLRIGLGARAQGMGGTFVAVADDPSAIYWNPAGLASLQSREVQASHVDWPAEVNFDHLTVVLPSRRLGGSVHGRGRETRRSSTASSRSRRRRHPVPRPCLPTRCVLTRR